MASTRQVRRPTTFISDDPQRPEDVLPPKRRPHEDEPDPNDPSNPDEPFVPDPDGDEPEDPEDPQPAARLPDSTVAADNSATAATASAPTNPKSSTPTPTPQLETPSASTAKLTTYRSRIAVVEAWRYPGSLKEAPEFVDRSWAAYVNEDEILNKPAGPALRVPVPRSAISPSPSDGVKICRVGDYMVLQKVTLAEEIEPEQTLDVWPKEEFEKLFIPETHHDQTVA